MVSKRSADTRGAPLTEAFDENQDEAIRLPLIFTCEYPTEAVVIRGEPIASPPSPKSPLPTSYPGNQWPQIVKMHKPAADLKTCSDGSQRTNLTQADLRSIRIKSLQSKHTVLKLCSGELREGSR